MKKRYHTLQKIIGLLFIAAFISSCSRINKATDFITNPSAKEIYQRDFKEAPELYNLWEEQAEKGLADSVHINLPYVESGRFFPKSFSVYSYDMPLNPGEQLFVELETDTLDVLVFMDIYRQENDSLGRFEHVRSAEYSTSNLQEEISEPGIYKLLIQPEIEASTPFQLRVYTQPVYVFPVASKGNAAIQSYWGATRDGGRRSHEGIDIFAPRGTPVVATTKGRVTSTGNKGLGGKQVWMRDGKRGNSLYYAHLDSIIATPGMSVSPGDTLGLVGNTGNARTTPPHLHFGIYKGFRGAINPLPFVFQTENGQDLLTPELEFTGNRLISKSVANLRLGPSTKFPVLKQSKGMDTLELLGKSNNWYHIRLDDRSSFIHESLVTPL